MKYLYTLIILICQFSYGQGFILDKTYGNDGLILSQTTKSNSFFLLEDNSILYVDYNSSGSYLTKLKLDGTVDSSFGEQGNVSISFQIKNYFIKNSEIYFCGYKNVFNGVYYHYDFVIAKLLSNGAFDLSFGDNGIVTKDLGEYEELDAIIINENDEIITVGTKGPNTSNSAVYQKLLILKLSKNGNFDKSYGDNGINQLFIFDSGNRGQNIFRTTNGYYIIVNGIDKKNNNYFGITKLDLTGNLDSDYATNGTLFMTSLKGVSLSKLYNESICMVNGYIDNNNFFANYNAVNYKTLAFENNFELINPRVSDFINEENNSIITLNNIVCSSVYCDVPNKIWLYKYLPSGELDLSFNQSGMYEINQQTLLSDFLKSGIYGFKIIKNKDGSIIIYGSLNADLYGNEYKIWSIKLNETPLSIDNFIKQKQLVLSPNPATNKVTISLQDNSEIEKVSVYNINGSLLIEESNSNTLDISRLNKGLYIVKIEVGKNIYTEKILKE